MFGRIVFFLVLTLSALAGSPVDARTAPAITGLARVIDGDTIDVAGSRLRLWGIDAPESKQTCERGGQTYACGREATVHLRALLADSEVVCEARGIDRYRRTIALCRVGSIDIGATMVRDGWALAFVRYSADYITEEQEAREARRGLWAGNFVAPWEWRARRAH